MIKLIREGYTEDDLLRDLADSVLRGITTAIDVEDILYKRNSKNPEKAEQIIDRFYKILHNVQTECVHKRIREGFGNRSQFTISVSTPKTYGDSRSDAVKDFLLKFWKEFVYDPDSGILDDLGIPVTGTTDCKCEVDDTVAYLYPRLDLTDIEQQDLSHAAFELNKSNIAKDYKAHFGYGWSSKMKSFYIQLQLPENLRRNSNYSWGPIGTESYKRLKEDWRDDNNKISDLVWEIESTGDSRKIEHCYDFIHRACDNIDDVFDGDSYDFRDASWAYGTDYIIEELTDILNESVRSRMRQSKKLRERNTIKGSNKARITDDRNYDGSHAFLVNSKLLDDQHYVNILRDFLPSYRIEGTGFSDEVCVFAPEQDLKKVQAGVDKFNSQIKESYRGLREKNVDIDVKNEGILEVPEGKNVDDLPMSHFEKLAKKKGLGKITKALNNLQVWNKNDDPKLSKWAGNMIDKLNKKLKKDESFYDRYDPNVEADFMEPGNLYDDMPDLEDLYAANKGLPIEDFIQDALDHGFPQEAIDEFLYPENYERDMLYKYESKKRIKENRYGYVHDEEEAKLPPSLRSYMRKTGWVPVKMNGKSYFEMDFNYGDVYCTMYVDEWGNCYLTTDGDDIRPSDMFYTITEVDSSVIDDLIKLGDTAASTGDFDSALDVFFGNV